MVEFEILEEEGNVLLIIVSLRGTDLEVGVLWYGVAFLVYIDCNFSIFFNSI